MNALESLDLANEVRFKRAALKRHMKAGDVTLAWVLRANKNYVQKMSLHQLLIACPGIYQVKAKRAMQRFNFRPRVQVGEISMQRREELLIWLVQTFPRAKVR